MREKEDRIIKMEFYHYKKDEIVTILDNCKYAELKSFIRLIYDAVTMPLPLTQLHSIKKSMMVDVLTKILQKRENLVAIATKIYSSEIAKFLYNGIVWSGEVFSTPYVEERYNCRFEEPRQYSSYSIIETPQKGRFSLITRVTRGKTYSSPKVDVLTMTESLRVLLKVVLPLPDDFHILPVKEPIETEHSYSNEVGIFHFIEIMEDMLKNSLVEFGKTNEKPKVKTLKMLKTATNIAEFYHQKKVDNLAVDMLTRSFYYYYVAKKKFEKSPLKTLKAFIKSESYGKLPFFISRVLLSHLNRIRFDSYSTREYHLFEVLEVIIEELPKQDWASIENILKFVRYRSLEFHFEYASTTSGYWFRDADGNEFNCDGEDYYTYFLYPIIKGAFFYLASLGLFEIKYNDLGTSYITAWEQLKYIKITPLGQYIFELSKSYEAPKLSSRVDKSDIKFDAFQPIISLQKDDVLSRAKLEPYCEGLGDEKMMLSYAKIFKECDTQKALELKIEAFYTNIEKNPPKVFRDFFDAVVQNANQLKRDTTKIVIELKNNKKLLNLFLTHKKLQEFIIKAQGYRIIVAEKDLHKLSKIAKDNGFFVEF